MSNYICGPWAIVLLVSIISVLVLVLVIGLILYKRKWCRCTTGETKDDTYTSVKMSDVPSDQAVEVIQRSSGGCI